MKKYLAILLSLALVFCFISCDGSTKTPDGSNGSSSNKPSLSIPVVPEDPNVPNKSKFVDADNSDLANIYAVFSELFESNAKSQVERYRIDWYEIKDGAYVMPEIGNISGKFSITQYKKYDEIKDYEEARTTYNGTIKLGEDEYVASNVAMVYHETKNEKSIAITGHAKKNGEDIDLNTLTSEDPLSKFINFKYFKYPPKDTDIGQVLLCKVNDPDFVGRYSGEFFMEGDLAEVNVVVDFSKVELPNGQECSLTCGYKATVNINEEVPKIEINYISLNGKYFKPESIEGDENIMKVLMMLFG